MSKKLIVGVLLVAFSSLPGKAQHSIVDPVAPIGISYDKIENKTSLHTDTVTVGPNVVFQLDYFSDGASPPSQAPDNVLIVWKGTYASPRFTQSHDATLLVNDSIRIKIPTIQKVNLVGTIFYETLIGILPLRDLKVIATAHSVEGRVGPEDIRFNAFAIKTFAVYLEALQGKIPSATSVGLAGVDADQSPKNKDILRDLAAPKYPKGIEVDGKVVFQFLVDSTGKIAPETLALISAADSSVVSSSAEAIRKWNLQPGTKNGKPVNVWVRSGFVFSAKYKRAYVLL